MYESFVPCYGLEFEYVTEANAFLENGVYNTSIGDLMPLAIATVLQASLVIITSNSQMPPMYVVPMVGTVEGSIFLIYNPTGAGHYDAALHYARQTITIDKTIPVELGGCSCGVNRKNSMKSCASNAFYSTRCKCYRKSKSCSMLCRCKECGNPFGARPIKHGVKRKRRPHSLQLVLPSSKKFALDRGEFLSTSLWSDLNLLY